MAQSNNKQKKHDPATLDQENNSGADRQEPAFSTGELGQLQEILFGQQQRSTHQQIGSVQEQFEAQMQSLSNMLNSRITGLTDTVENSNKQFEERLQQLGDDHQTAIKALDKKVIESSAALKDELNALSQTSDEEKRRVHAEIEQHESTILSEIANTKQSLSSQLKQSVDGLQSAKIDRHDFANLLNDLSNKLGGTPASIAK